MKEKLNYKKIILELVEKENGRPIPVGIILRKLEETIKNKSIIFDTIEQLIKSGNLRKNFNNKIVLGYPEANVNMSTVSTGIIAINNKMTGFITELNKDKSGFFVHKSNLNGALDGDTVEFANLDIKTKDGQTLIDAKVLKVLKHKKNHYVGTFIIKDNDYVVVSDDEKMYMPIRLTITDGLLNGSKILFEVIEFGEKELLANTIKIIGHKDDVGSDILSIVYDNGVDPIFSDELLSYTDNIKVNVDDYQKKIRKDLTSLPIVTIDPSTSKDFDDAICTFKLENGSYRLIVCIADVSHYVKWNSLLDLEAIKRGCSIYLVDRVIPMLPHNLSNDICSLNPNVKRLTLTADMIIDSNGKFKSIDVYPSIIKSARRFSYDEVNDFFSGKSKLEKDTDEIKMMLNTSKELHLILTKMKNIRGYIEFDIPEPKILVNDKCEPIEISLRETGVAQKMIEDFMVAANEAVTIQAEKYNWDFIYRIHDKPEETKLKTFSIEAKKLNFKITKDIEDIKPNTIAYWLENNQTNPNIDLINMMLLRTMAKAKYDITNIGHFGLASSNYTHFTSPIRRYPDLIVHRIYWMFLFEKDKYTNSQRESFIKQLKQYCESSNKAELIAVKCERDVNDMKFAEYMQKHVGEEFDAMVTSVTPFGIFIQLNNTIEGLIRIVNMKDDFYSYDDTQLLIIGRNKKQRFSLGTKLTARVISSNKEQRKIEFELVKFLGNR